MFIIQSEVRRFALETAANTKFRIAGDNRVPRFTRVSSSFLEAINAATMKAVTERINQHGSKGQTLT